MDMQIILVLGGLIATAAGFLYLKLISRRLALGIALIAFFLPFERIPTLHAAGFNLKINHILGLALLLWWGLSWLNSRYYPRRNRLALPLWLFVITQTIALLPALNLTRSLAFYLLTLFVIGITTLTYDLVRERADLALVERALVISAWVVLIFSIWQFLGDMVGLPLWLTGLIEGYGKITFGFPRIQAFSKEPLYLGNYLLIPLGLVIGHWLGSNKIRWDQLLLVAGLLGVMILTLSRGAYLGLLVFILMLVFLAPKKIFRPKILAAIVAIIIAAGLAMLVVFQILGPDKTDKFLSHVTVSDLGTSESTVSRLTASMQAIEMWQSAPLTGVGVGNFGAVRVGNDPSAPAADNIVNNEYAELLAESGLLGLGTFLLILVVLFARAAKAWLVSRGGDDPLRGVLIGLTAAFAGILAQYFFFSTISIIHIWFLIGLLLAVAELVIARAGKADDART